MIHTLTVPPHEPTKPGIFCETCKKFREVRGSLGNSMGEVRFMCTEGHFVLCALVPGFLSDKAVFELNLRVSQ